MSKSIILIGASVRAAAFSALRAGLNPWCIDLFADSDLRAVAPVQRCPFLDYPGALLQMVRQAPAGPVVYTGGLENQPDLIGKIGLEREVWGNAPAALNKCRDPYFLAQLFSRADIAWPHVSRSAEALTNLGLPCLRKPRSGAGGANITRVTKSNGSRGFFYQQFMTGISCSAVFCALTDRTELLGVTEQLVGETWLHAKHFQYCGTIGPLPISTACESMLKRIGETLRGGCGLRGLFGVDFILRNGVPWPIEVNPRYTASIEILEHTIGLRALACHRAAFEITTQIDVPSRNLPFAGKAILFAPRPITFPANRLEPSDTDPWRLPTLADVPAPGDPIDAGWPILTVFASAGSVEECRQLLMDRAGEVYSGLFNDG